MKSSNKEELEPQRLSFCQKTYNFYFLGIPAMLCNIVRFSQDVMNLYAAGHMPNAAVIAGVGLGNMT